MSDAQKILSEDEVSELLSSYDEAPDPKPAPETDEISDLRVQPYDFKRPNRVSKEQIRAFRGIHDKMARALSAHISGLVRSVAEISLQSVEQMSYAEFLALLENPTSFNVFSMKPLDATGVLEISPSVAYSMIDQLLGGSGENYENSREFSDIELNLLDGILKQIMQILKDVWAPVVEVFPSVDAKESSPSVLQIVAQNEIVIVVTLRANIGKTTGFMNICYPVISLEGFLSRLLNRDLMLSETSHKKSRNKDLQALLGGAVVNLSAEIGFVKIPISQILNLRPGDLLRLNRKADDTVVVAVDGRVKFTADVGHRGFSKIIKITAHEKNEKDNLKEILKMLENERREQIAQITNADDENGEKNENS